MNAIRIATCRGLVRNSSITAQQCQKNSFRRRPAARVFSTPASKSGGGSNSSTTTTTTTTSNSLKNAKTSAGTGDPEGLGADGKGGFSMRGPVTWPALGLVAVAAAAAVTYYKIERERRLENAMGKIVSSESGWSPNPELLARRQYVLTKWGWFPKEDAFGAGEFITPSCQLSSSIPWDIILCFSAA